MLLDSSLEVRSDACEKEQIAIGDGAGKQWSFRRCRRNLVGLRLWRIILLFEFAGDLCCGGFGQHGAAGDSCCGFGRVLQKTSSGLLLHCVTPLGKRSIMVWVA